MWTDYTFFSRKKRGHGVMVQSRGSWRPWSGVHLLSLQQRGFVRQAPGMCIGGIPGCQKVTTWEALFIPIKMVMTWWFIIGFTTCLYIFQVAYGRIPGSNNSVLFQQNACRRYMSICAPTSSPESGRILRFRPMMLDFAHHFLCDSLEK